MCIRDSGYSVITLDNGFLKVVRSANVKTSPGMIADSSRPGVGGTRTRDFYKDFADSLSLLYEVILVDIYFRT